MKRLYWRPKGVSRTILILLTVFCVGGLVAVEHFEARVRQPYYREKLAAARLAQKAMEAIKMERIALRGPLDLNADPASSGIIGPAMSEITSSAGALAAKQTTANPNWAAVLVHMLKRADVEEEDQIAVGYSGSFPALNVALLAAIEVLHLHPIIIASAASSQFGGNDTEFAWLDMERLLVQRRIFSSRSIAATVGGIEDLALGMPEEGRQKLVEVIERNDVPLLEPTSFDDSIKRRLDLYQEQAGAKPIKAYVNVGGGAISVGRNAGKKAFEPGLNFRAPRGTYPIDSIMSRFVEDGTPVIHMVRVMELAERFGLPIQPPTTPAPGEGGIFYREEYNRYLVVGILALIVLSLYALVRSDIGFRLLATKGVRRVDKHPEPMV